MCSSDLLFQRTLTRWHSFRFAGRLQLQVFVYTLQLPDLILFAFSVQVWGSTIGSTVLQNQLRTRLPPEFLAQFPGGVSLAYSAIPIIKTLDEPLKSEVRAAFADSISIIWKVMIGVSALGALASLLMKGLPLHTDVDEKWGLEEDAATLTASCEDIIPQP